MKLDLSLTDLKALVAEALLTQMTAEARGILIKEAIEGLLTPQTDRYGTGASKLQEAFRSAVYDVAKGIVAEHLKTDAEVRAAIEKLVTAAFQKLLSAEHYGGAVDKIADALATALARGLDR